MVAGNVPLPVHLGVHFLLSQQWGGIGGASDTAEGGEVAPGTGDQQQATLQNPLLLAWVREMMVLQVAVCLPGSLTNITFCFLVFQLKEDIDRLLVSQYPGDVVSTKVTFFTSPQFSKVWHCTCVILV